MDAHLIVGIGNIYAAESLFLAGISPCAPPAASASERCARLAGAVKETLAASIAAGGSSVRDYVHSDGGAGCFQLQCASTIVPAPRTHRGTPIRSNGRPAAAPTGALCCQT